MSVSISMELVKCISRSHLTLTKFYIPVSTVAERVWLSESSRVVENVWLSESSFVAEKVWLSES